jgi:hypothetical protein
VRFAGKTPAVSTLRALLSDLRAHVPDTDQVTNDTLRSLRGQLARGALRARGAEASTTRVPRETARGFAPQPEGDPHEPHARP